VCLAGPWPSIAYTMGFLATVDCLYIVGPDEVEYGIVALWYAWVPLHSLVMILVQLQLFGVLPVRPVCLFE
jgi:hypothetical protein